ncbi:MAG: 4Fe-4S dicluster domain-containing protein [Proteobacteria bacterium]|nr:4Fe-4S dicluster domain-containing protein [Pseudomonadota bacterium]
MGFDRRDFLKIAGITAVSLGAKPALDAVLGDTAQAETQALRPGVSKAETWAMVIDTRKLTEEDIHKAIEACHSEHNVPDIRLPNHEVNIKEEVKWLWADQFDHVFPDHSQAFPYLSEEVEEKQFLALCNHCTEPPCVRVCPTKATFKRPDGIVMMDMHRCIGCRFCMAGCPYGSRSFNWGDPRPWIRKVNPKYPTRMKGVVEKCNFCAERLAKGQFPACVEAVESGALVFGDLSQPGSAVRDLLRKHNVIRRKPSLGTGPNVYYII